MSGLIHSVFCLVFWGSLLSSCATRIQSNQTGKLNLQVQVPDSKLKCAHPIDSFKKELLKNPAETYSALQLGDERVVDMYLSAWCDTYAFVRRAVPKAIQQLNQRVESWKAIHQNISQLKQLSMNDPASLFETQAAQGLWKMFSQDVSEFSSQHRANISSQIELFFENLDSRTHNWLSAIQQWESESEQKTFESFLNRSEFAMDDISLFYLELGSALNLLSLSKTWRLEADKDRIYFDLFIPLVSQSRSENIYTNEGQPNFVQDQDHRIVGLPSFTSDPFEHFLELRGTPVYLLGVTTDFLGVERGDTVDGMVKYPSTYLSHDVDHMFTSVASDLQSFLLDSSGSFVSVPVISCEIQKSTLLFQRLAHVEAEDVERNTREKLHALLFFLTHEYAYIASGAPELSPGALSLFGKKEGFEFNYASATMNVEALSYATEVIQDVGLNLSVAQRELLDEAGIGEGSEEFKRLFAIIVERLNAARRDSAVTKSCR